MYNRSIITLSLLILTTFTVCPVHAGQTGRSPEVVTQKILLNAINKGDFDSVQELILYKKTKINAVDKDGYTLLDKILLNELNFDHIQLLLQHKNIDMKKQYENGLVSKLISHFKLFVGDPGYYLNTSILSNKNLEVIPVFFGALYCHAIHHSETYYKSMDQAYKSYKNANAPINEIPILDFCLQKLRFTESHTKHKELLLKGGFPVSVEDENYKNNLVVLLKNKQCIGLRFNFTS